MTHALTVDEFIELLDSLNETVLQARKVADCSGVVARVGKVPA